MALNPRQRAFVEAYTGNATEAARQAGYAGSDATLAVTGSQLLRNPKVRAAIEARTAKASQSRIATRAERQAFWTSVMHDGEQSMRDRLKAAELLGRSEADFVDRIEHSADSSFAELLKAARKRADGE